MDIGEGIQLAFQYYQAGRLQEAKTICSEILQVQPGNFDAIGLLGAVYYEFRDYPTAIEYLKKALQINPTNANVYYNLGLSLHEQATLDEAIVNYRKELQLEPDFADVHYYLGAALKREICMRRWNVFIKHCIVTLTILRHSGQDACLAC